MNSWKSLTTTMVVLLMMTWAPFGFGAVSPEDAAKLGTTLTRFGAEMAGNKDGTIPSYTGGLTKAPADYKPGSGIYADPFPEERPLFSINAQNMNQYADKLTEGTKAVMKRHPTFRIDVYKTRRTVAYPEYVLKSTAKNAVKAVTIDDGLSVEGAHAGIPFPIPKDGYEAMWNHQLRFMGRALRCTHEGYLSDAAGKVIMAQKVGDEWDEYPYYDEDPNRPDSHLYWKVAGFWIGPPRHAGENAMMFDAISYKTGRVAYQYLPGQRRVKLAPEIGFDTPDSWTAGSNTFDEAYIFMGSMERYNWKLIGKKEFYVPYNAYKAVFHAKKDELFGPRHLNPDMVRWELHRMWIVEATLRPGYRHIYPKRRFYIDEDSWAALANENYDAKGDIFKVNLAHMAPSYDIPAPQNRFVASYNMVSNFYYCDHWHGNGCFVRPTEVRPLRDWSPNSLTGRGIR